MSPLPIESYKLANGLEVFLVEKKDIPMATVMIAVKNGAYVEDETNNGLAHLYEHMFFKANSKIPSQREFIRAIDEMGIEMGPNMNAHTSTEFVRYFFTVQTQYLDRGLRFMADALITPKFIPEELENERKVVIGEFDRYEASPSDTFFQKGIMGRLFSKYFVRKNTIGSRPVILGATQQQMHDIQHRYYIPNNTALMVVGDFDEGEVRKTIEEAYGNWKPGPNPFEKYPVPGHPPLEKTETFNEYAPVQTVNLALAYQGPKLTKDDRSLLSFDLMSLMLSFESSPFQKELVHSGLASSASFFVWDQRYTSPLVFTVEALPNKAQGAADKLRELIKRIGEPTFFSERDLEVAKNSIEVNSAYERESGTKLALTLANVWCMTGSLDYYTNYVQNVKAITLADIHEAYKKYIQSQPYVFGALQPKGSKPIQLQ